MAKYKAAVLQMDSGRNKEENFKEAEELLAQAVSSGAKLAAFPEYFHYGGRSAAEEIPGGETCLFMSEQAKKHGIWLLSGSFSEKNPLLSDDAADAGSGKPFNTAALFAPDGTYVTKYRKLHLCDIYDENGPLAEESAHLAAGCEPVMADLGDFGLFGLSTCYDIRFPELYRYYALSGASAVFVPSDFGMKTGRAHREVLLRARAIENGLYIIAPQQCGPSTLPGQTSCGQSMIIDPWGRILAKLEDDPGIAVAEIDTDYVTVVRNQLGTLKNRRTDLYEVIMR